MTVLFHKAVTNSSDHIENDQNGLIVRHGLELLQVTVPMGLERENDRDIHVCISMPVKA
jgi:hypothetical protein